MPTPTALTPGSTPAAVPSTTPGSAPRSSLTRLAPAAGRLTIGLELPLDNDWGVERGRADRADGRPFGVPDLTEHTRLAQLAEYVLPHFPAATAAPAPALAAQTAARRESVATPLR
ncbi:hypothetical protein AB0F57_13370 [Streptomyces tanashiensis]|uniref:hypothetical protein n=1 Tax=Streptomyces tanashiensis TaxID=67367 RepID=UPI0033C8AD2A